METKELKIEAPKGYEIDKERSTFERIIFKPINKNITYKDVCANIFTEQGYYINSWGVIKFNTLGIDKVNGNNATNEHQLERLLALNQLLNIAEYYNKLHSKQNNCCLYYVSFEKEYGYSVRPHYIENDWLNSVIALFNSKEDAQAVIDNPNFQEILDTIYKD